MVMLTILNQLCITLFAAKLHLPAPMFNIIYILVVAGFLLFDQRGIAQPIFTVM